MANKPSITAEEFASWQADPVTQAVVAELSRAADLQKAAWLDLSWNANVADLTELHVLKTRADAYRSLAELTFEDLVEIPE